MEIKLHVFASPNVKTTDVNVRGQHYCLWIWVISHTNLREQKHVKANLPIIWCLECIQIHAIVGNESNVPAISYP